MLTYISKSINAYYSDISILLIIRNYIYIYKIVNGNSFLLVFVIQCYLWANRYPLHHYLSCQNTKIFRNTRLIHWIKYSRRCICHGNTNDLVYTSIVFYMSDTTRHSQQIGHCLQLMSFIWRARNSFWY